MTTISEKQVRELEEALLSLERVRVRDLLIGPQESPLHPSEVESLLVPALKHIGEEWEMGRIALSQIYMASRLCEDLMDSLLPPSDPDRITQPRMAICSLEDYHLLGMRLVYSTLRASGYELLRYGRQDMNGLIRLVLADEIKILMISVLMLPSALHIREFKRRLDETGYRIKLIVGGAPFRFDPQLWREVGAHATSDSAGGAVDIVRQLSKECAA